MNFLEVCKNGNINEINLMIENGETDWNWGIEGACLDAGLYGACEAGHMNIVKLMIENGATWWNWGLRGACKGGHINSVNLMIEKGATDWNWGLEVACRVGHMNIVKLMIEKGVDINTLSSTELKKYNDYLNDLKIKREIILNGLLKTTILPKHVIIDFIL
jgi:ankyrin repeat protein